jgi:probable phosphoglycerate mutase
MTQPVRLFSSRFIFVRHGQSEANAQKIFAGSLDFALTERGREEARQAAAWLAGETIGSVFASPLQRVWETAEIIAESKGAADIQAVDGISERNYGAWEGKPRGDFDRAEQPPGGESPEVFNARTVAALKSIAGAPTILVVGHSGTFRALRSHLLSVTEYEYASVENARPVAFLPPKGRDDSWVVEPLGG